MSLDGKQLLSLTKLNMKFIYDSLKIPDSTRSLEYGDVLETFSRRRNVFRTSLGYSEEIRAVWNVSKETDFNSNSKLSLFRR